MTEIDGKSEKKRSSAVVDDNDSRLSQYPDAYTWIRALIPLLTMSQFHSSTLNLRLRPDPISKVRLL